MSKCVLQSWLLVAALAATAVFPGARVWAQPVDEAMFEALQQRLDAQQMQIQALEAQLLERQQVDAPAPFPPLEEGCPCQDQASGSEPTHLRYYADYDHGIVIRPFNLSQSPFTLQVNGWAQFRHHGFARDVETWTDNAGVTRAVRNRNAFDIERARLVLSGQAIDPRMSYQVLLDGDSDGGHAVDFFLYWVTWKFNDRFQLFIGKRKLPASRQWLISSRQARLVDRPMATDFFRPDRTLGLFGQGKIGQHGHYEVMVGNSFHAADVPNAGADDQFTFAATHFVDPWGDYGLHIVDFDCSPKPLLRFGHSFVFSPQKHDVPGVPLPEINFLRLTDGTIATQTGALAPGVTVSEFDIFLYTVDVGWKWRGWSFDAEAYFRWVEQIEGDGPLPVTDLLQKGFYVEGGRFLIPRCLDINFRYSQISGLFGASSEYGAGLNWYPLRTYNMRLSFDVTSLDGSPLQNTSTDILVGDDGVLFRTQFQVDY